MTLVDFFSGCLLSLALAMILLSLFFLSVAIVRKVLAPPHRDNDDDDDDDPRFVA